MSEWQFSSRGLYWNILAERPHLEANYVLFPPPILIIYVLIHRVKNSVNYGAQDSGRHSLLDS